MNILHKSSPAEERIRQELRETTQLNIVDLTLKDTIAAFKGILNGDYDSLPEQAFYMVGGIEEAVEKAKSM